MTSHAWRLPPAFDPLIAEAKRRAKQRRVAVGVVVVLAVGSSVGTLGASRWSAAAAGPRPVRSAFVASMFGQSLVQAHGPAGVFAPRFGVSLVVGNGSTQPVTLEGVRAVLDARHSPVDQIGTRFTPWKRAGGCATGDLPVCAAMPVAATRPAPLRLAPGHQALVQLNFRFLTCTPRELPEALSLKTLTAIYRLPDGTRVSQHAPVILGYGYPANPALVRALHALSKNQAFVPLGNVTTFGKVTTRPCQR